MPAHFLVSGNLQHSVLVVLTLWSCSITVCWWKRRRRRRIRWNDCHTVGKRVQWVHTDGDISVACKWTFALNFLIWFFPRPRFFKLHMEKPQKHASTHTLDTEAESSNKLNDQLYSWTPTTHPRKQELPRIRRRDESSKTSRCKETRFLHLIISQMHRWTEKEEEG